MAKAIDILIVEDDRRLADMTGELLELQGFQVVIEYGGLQALQQIARLAPKLLILDIGLPGLDGLSICRNARANGFGGHILMLTARGQVSDEILGLELGADDYLAKPVHPPRLVARVRALLRRPARAMAQEAPIETGDLKIYPHRREATLSGQVLDLSTAEFELLLMLGEHLGQVVSRDEIYQKLRGHAYDGVDRSIDLRISRLRKVLKEGAKAQRYVKTVFAQGYLLARLP